MRLKLLILGILFSHSTFAGVYKCIGAEGNTSYQTKPCGSGEQTIEINFKTGEAIDKQFEMAKQVEDLEKQKLQEQARLEEEQRRQQLIIDAKAETEKNQFLIKSDTSRFSAYAIPPYEPGKLSSLVTKFEERLPDIERMRRLAALKVLDTKQCSRVEASELNIKSTQEKLLFLVNCSNGQGIYLSEDQLN
ncbi:MAG: DUF4124 domain-containing protein [Gammaproteobacteria bacterium HGW-Gammaproteobacteria-10]|nr:MAG: DUF4124 domain-containing protein [Gammaproteobacteria bacterium HGW-Gammaproteobacteria-3]PKM35071.1 MAG: DUF4124 domain-containing protein [Gammaproteobacteria bacterium HGW-Gammaproteobacteria-10]